MRFFGLLHFRPNADFQFITAAADTGVLYSGLN
jgi:hypothetical protein